MLFFTWLTLFCFVSLAAARELPTEIPICKKTDSKCMCDAFTKVLEVFAQGNKEFGIPKIEPVLVKKVRIPGNGGSINLEQIYTDTYLHGLTKLIPNSITVKATDSEYVFDVDARSDELQFIGTYEAKGKMLLFDVNGGGASNLTIKNLKGHITLKCEVYNKDDHSFLKLKNFEVDLRSGSLFLDYENLINNNPTLSKAVLDAVNENSDDVFSYLKRDYASMMSEALKVVVVRIFSVVPLDKLFLD